MFEKLCEDADAPQTSCCMTNQVPQLVRPSADWDIAHKLWPATIGEPIMAGTQRPGDQVSVS